MSLITSKKIFWFIAAFIFAVLLFFGLRKGYIAQTDELNILVMGIDTPSGWKARSDSINLVHIDFAKNRVGILAIPRDTLVDIPGHGQDKINHAHMYGGPELSLQTVSKYLDIPVNYYVEINFPMFIGLIDQMGGISLDVEKYLYYDDWAGNLHIHLKPGLQKLSGYEAMGYMRFRHDRTSDWGRIDRQHKFFQAFLGELFKPSNLWKIPQMFYSVSSNTRTNLSPSQIVKIGLRFKSILTYGKIDMGTIPGGDAQLEGGYYMLSNSLGKKKVIDDVIFGKKN